MIQDEIEQLIQPTVESMGCILWGCEYLAQGKYSLLRIYIDKTEGITVEDCENISRQVSALLDVHDPISGQYSLEVSSPGVPRPLFYGHQYQQYIGHEIQVKLTKPIAGRRKLKGVIVSCDDETIVIKTETEQLNFPFSTIVKANLTV